MAATSWDPNQPQIEADHCAAPRIIYGFLEANSQTFKAGAIVYLNSEAVTVCAADATSIAGIAMKDATNVSSGNIEIPIMVIDGNSRIRLHCTNGATAALASSGTTGTRYSSYVDSDGVLKADHADSGTAAKNCWKFVEPLFDATATSTHFGYFIPVGTAIMFSSGETVA